MKLTIFGASGRTGQHLVQQALEAGHSVTALARTPSKISVQHPGLTLIQGDILDPACVEQAVSVADAVLSVLGPTANKPDYIITKGTRHMLDAMQKHSVRRLIISAGAGVPDPNDDPQLINHVISFLLNVFSRHVVADMLQVVDLVRRSDRDWTIVRVPMLTDQPRSGQIRVGWVGKGTGPRLSRADMAAFMLQQLEQDTFMRQAPVISN